MLEKLQIVQQRFDEVSDLIIQPDIIADQKIVHENLIELISDFTFEDLIQENLIAENLG